jgi:hypothetical protein
VSNENFLLYAAQHYDNPTCQTEADFISDINKIKFVLKMIKRYEREKVLNERLILNHLILLYNVFRPDAATRMLVLKCENHLPILKPFLVFLNFWPEKIDNVKVLGSVLIGTDISMDPLVVDKLRKI